MIAIALLGAPAAGAHDDDDDDGYYPHDDEGGWYGGAGHGDWCDDDHGCRHAAGIPRFDMLHGHGAWRYVPAFGAHLWFPWVDVSWRPYYYGHWVRTTFGMTWVSHEPWGDIPHHYGHWVYVEPFGWGWVPGWEWAPAYVTWGVVDGYVGWAPCPPPGYRYPRYHGYRTSIHVSTYGFSGAFGYHDSGLDFGFWVFVADRDFCGSPVWRHALPAQRSLSLFKSKQVLPVGPRIDVNYVQRISPSKVRAVPVDPRTKRVGDRSIQGYEARGQKELIRSGRDAARRAYTKSARVERVSAPRDPRGGNRIEGPRRATGSRSPAASPERVKAGRESSREPQIARKAEGSERGREPGAKSKAPSKAPSKSRSPERGGKRPGK
jgi:hypothetical protein